MKIVTIECTNCSGRGYHETTTRTYDPKTKLWIEQTERDECADCDGTGSITIISR